LVSIDFQISFGYHFYNIALQLTTNKINNENKFECDLILFKKPAIVFLYDFLLFLAGN